MKLVASLGAARAVAEATSLLQSILETIPDFWLAKRIVLGSDDLLLTLNAEMITANRGIDHALTAFRRADVLESNGELNMPFPDGRPGIYRIPQQILEKVKDPPVQPGVSVAFWLCVVDLRDSFGTRNDAVLFPIHVHHLPLTVLP